jgi:hypothetical protein
MSDTPETDAAQIFLGVNPDEGDYFVPVKIAHKLERERDETKENLKITQDAWIQAKVERVEATRVRDEAVNNYETAVLREHRMQEQRDEAKETAERYRLEANAMMMQRDMLIEAVREAWYAMDEVEGVDKLDAWQNKYAKYIEGTLI